MAHRFYLEMTVLPQMVFVKGGRFQMGSNEEKDEKPPHRVQVADFELSKYPVTQKQWKFIMGNNPSRFKGDDLPVETVSWEDCQRFIQKLNELTGLNFRLPTEAEWEYAAGGGANNRTKWAGTNDESQLGEYAWNDKNSKNHTHPGGEKRANSLGLYDMSGNVCEWCEDDWHGNYSGAPADGRAWVDSPRGSGRVYRLGSLSNTAGNCRVARRSSNSPDQRRSNLGFRLAR